MCAQDAEIISAVFPVIRGSSGSGIAAACLHCRVRVARVGPLATLRCKPRQARKGAAAAADAGAGVWLARAAASPQPPCRAAR